MKTTGRVLIVKGVGYRARRTTPKDWTPPRIEEELKLIQARTKHVAQRHYPTLQKPIADGSRCVFINDFTYLGDTSGMLFTVCSYVKGHAPEAFSPKMEVAKVDVDVMNLSDPEGDPRELAYTYRVLAYGQIMIVENVMGAGGVGGLEKLLRSLLKAFNPPAHGLIELSDIESQNLRELIRSKNGIKEIRAKLLHDVSGKGSKYSKPLTSLKQSVAGTNRCAVVWEATDKEEIDIDDAMELLEDSAFDGVSVKFNDGGGFSELTEYRERKPVRIQVTPEGRVAVTEIEAELKAYLKSLRNPDVKGPITYEGILWKNLQKLGK